MKNLFLAILTTLFVSAMPLQAAYALADDATGKEACLTTTYSDLFNSEVLSKIAEQKGKIVEMEGARAAAFQSRVEDLYGQEAPFKSDRISLVYPNDEAETIVNVAYFVDGCLKAVMHFPPDILEKLLSPLEKKPGERVD